MSAGFDRAMSLDEARDILLHRHVNPSVGLAIWAGRRRLPGRAEWEAAKAAELRGLRLEVRQLPDGDWQMVARLAE